MLSSLGPVAGAAVSIEGESYSALTDKQGRYRLSNVLPGQNYQLLVQRAGFELQEHALSLKAGEQQHKDFQLKADQQTRTGSLKGTLTDTSGQVIAEATIETQPPSQSVTTDAQGQFEIPNLLPGAYYVSGSKEGKVLGSRFVSMGSGQSITLAIKGLAVSEISNSACSQQNINNINIDVPGAEVTVVINNQNECRITSP